MVSEKKQKKNNPLSRLSAIILQACSNKIQFLQGKGSLLILFISFYYILEVTDL